jgi:ABC-type branched-subunit amino acid transport system substrate-binding protein
MFKLKLTNSATPRLTTIFCLLLIALLAPGWKWPWGKVRKPSIPEAERNIIKIGAIAPLTGDAAIYGTWFKNGINLGVEELNNSGGIDNKKIQIIYEDDKASPAEGCRCRIIITG